jgi:hypothetical protein
MNSAEDIEIDLRSVHTRSHDTIACPNCGIYQTVGVDYDRGQGYAALSVIPCSVWHQDLWSFCDQDKCECGQIVCRDCTVTGALWNVPRAQALQTLCSPVRSALPRLRGIRQHDAPQELRAAVVRMHRLWHGDEIGRRPPLDGAKYQSILDFMGIGAVRTRRAFKEFIATIKTARAARRHRGRFDKIRACCDAPFFWLRRSYGRRSPLPE